MSGLTHFDNKGEAHMVDVSNKPVTSRVATARGYVKMAPETLDYIIKGEAKKGDVLAVARLAGIMGCKQTSTLIPLCHPLPITNVTLEFDVNKTENLVNIEATVRTTGQTGVEMEALTAVSVAGLTIYDMLKAVDRGMIISSIRVSLKDGGKSGLFEAD